MENKFKPGDVVQLKSGGPIMTIRAFDMEDGKQIENRVICAFFPFDVEKKLR